MTPSEAVEKAVSDAGGTGALAKALGIKPPSVSEWLRRGKAPAERCIEIESLDAVTVTRYDLRPDVFGQRPKGKAA